MKKVYKKINKVKTIERKVENFIAVLTAIIEKYIMKTDTLKADISLDIIALRGELEDLEYEFKKLCEKEGSDNNEKSDNIEKN